MSVKKFSLIAAACENYGIGINGSLPWRLKDELKYFHDKTSKTNDLNKKNAVIMGRKTYFGIPESKRPLHGRLNIVLTSTGHPKEYSPDVVLCKSINDAIKLINDKYQHEIENIWIVGGNQVYKEAMESNLCHRIYFTEIKAKFDCDTFFPKISDDEFKRVPNDSDVPNEVQEENGLKYQYQTYEKIEKN